MQPFQLRLGPCGALGHCRISPAHFLAECRKRRLNQGSFVSAVCLIVYFLWFVFISVYVCIFVIYIDFFPYCLFVSNSQVIGCEESLRNDIYCVGWGIKLYSIQSSVIVSSALALIVPYVSVCPYVCVQWRGGLWVVNRSHITNEEWSTSLLVKGQLSVLLVLWIGLELCSITDFHRYLCLTALAAMTLAVILCALFS